MTPMIVASLAPASPTASQPPTPAATSSVPTSSQLFEGALAFLIGAGQLAAISPSESIPSAPALSSTLNAHTNQILPHVPLCDSETAAVDECVQETSDAAPLDLLTIAPHVAAMQPFALVPLLQRGTSAASQHPLHWAPMGGQVTLMHLSEQLHVELAKLLPEASINIELLKEHAYGLGVTIGVEQPRHTLSHTEGDKRTGVTSLRELLNSAAAERQEFSALLKSGTAGNSDNGNDQRPMQFPLPLLTQHQEEHQTASDESFPVLSDHTVPTFVERGTGEVFHPVFNLFSASSETQSILPERLHAALRATVLLLQRSGSKQAVMVLQPESLGTVVVRLIPTAAGTTMLSIVVSSPQAYSLIAQTVESLRMELHQASIATEAIALHLRNEGSKDVALSPFSSVPPSGAIVTAISNHLPQRRQRRGFFHQHPARRHSTVHFEHSV